METDGTECSAIQVEGEGKTGNLIIKFSGLKPPPKQQQQTTNSVDS